MWPPYKYPLYEIDQGDDRADDGAQRHTDPMVDGMHGINANAHKGCIVCFKKECMAIFA
jgi:hypothetical protein